MRANGTTTRVWRSPWQNVRMDAEHVVLGILVLWAVLTLAAWQRSSLAGLLSHDGAQLVSPPQRFGGFVAAWLLMALVTMLPTTVDVLRALRIVASRHGSAYPATIAAVTGIVVVWWAVGVAVALGDQALHTVVDANHMQPSREAVVGSVALLAGAYELSPLATRCLSACRSPIGFVARHWRGASSSRLTASRIGASYGASCMACCAGLMVVMCAIGMTSPLAMVGAGGWTWFTKRSRSGLVLLRTTGGALVVAGAVLLLSVMVGAH